MESVRLRGGTVKTSNHEPTLSTWTIASTVLDKSQDEGEIVYCKTSNAESPSLMILGSAITDCVEVSWIS